MSKKFGMPPCAMLCHQQKQQCMHKTCRKWIDFPEEQNCCLISIHENGPMTLRLIGDRLKISFARVKQIETIAIKKMKNYLPID